MTVRRLRGASRSGFTLIELLIVITIIVVLISLLMSGVMKALSKGPEIQTRVEIGQLETAVQTVIQTYQLKFVPSQITLSEKGTYPASSAQFLKRMFPRLDLTTPIDWNRNGNLSDPDVTLQGQECLVFFLGGPNNKGFSANPSNPADPINSIQPQAFEFKSKRLLPSPRLTALGVTGYYVYLNNYGPKAQPYLYFSSSYSGNDYAADCAAYSVAPYFDSVTSKFINANGFQIVSAGADGVFGPGGTSWSPTAGTTNLAAKDDQANFAPGLLVAGQ